MAKIFWDTKGILLVRYISHKIKVNADYYCDILKDLKAAICQKQPHLKAEDVWFLHDNGLLHTTQTTMAFLEKLGRFVFGHPLY